MFSHSDEIMKNFFTFQELVEEFNFCSKGSEYEPRKENLPPKPSDRSVVDAPAKRE